MKKLLEKRVKSIGVVVALFIIINVALSFAYIRGGSVGSESVSTVALEGGSINVRYSSNSGSIVASDIVPGYETTKQFTITSEYGNNHEYYDLGLWYQINLVVDKNEFGDGSLTYSLFLDEASDNDGVPATNVEYAPIPSGQNLKGISVGAGRLINDNKSHIYNLKITYAETLTDQSDEIGCRFEAHITLTNPKIVKIIFDLDGGEISVPGYNEASKSLTSATNSLYTLPTPYKSGYSFNGWEVVSRNATLDGNILSVNEENVTLKANYKVQSFATDTWEEIAFNVRHGATDGYNVGETREISLNGLTNSADKPTFTLRIANKQTPETCNQEGFSQTACGFVLEFAEVIARQQMNPSATNIGGWSASTMRTYLNESILGTFPVDLKNVIIDTYVVSGHGSGDSTNFISTDKLYLLSTKEVWGSNMYDTVSETRQLEYYGQNGVNYSNYSGAIKKKNVDNVDKDYLWSIRSALSDSNSSFNIVRATGSNADTTSSTKIYGHSASNFAGVSPAFRIG